MSPLAPVVSVEKKSAMWFLYRCEKIWDFSTSGICLLWRMLFSDNFWRLVTFEKCDQSDDLTSPNNQAWSQCPKGPQTFGSFGGRSCKTYFQKIQKSVALWDICVVGTHDLRHLENTLKAICLCVYVFLLAQLERRGFATAGCTKKHSEPSHLIQG